MCTILYAPYEVVHIIKVAQKIANWNFHRESLYCACAYMIILPDFITVFNNTWLIDYSIWNDRSQNRTIVWLVGCPEMVLKTALSCMIASTEETARIPTTILYSSLSG